MSKCFSCMHVADVQFHKQYAHTRQRIPNSHGSICEGARIDSDTVDSIRARVVDATDDGPFMVGLEMRYLDASEEARLVIADSICASVVEP